MNNYVKHGIFTIIGGFIGYYYMNKSFKIVKKEKIELLDKIEKLKYELSKTKIKEIKNELVLIKKNKSNNNNLIDNNLINNDGDNDGDNCNKEIDTSESNISKELNNNDSNYISDSSDSSDKDKEENTNIVLIN